MKENLYKILILTVLVIIACSIYLVAQPLPTDRLIENNQLDSKETKASRTKNNLKSLKPNEKISITNPYLENNLGTQVLHSSDLFATAVELLDLAKQGNSEAQYWLFDVLQYCGFSLAFREDSMQRFVASYKNELERELISIRISRCYAFDKDNITTFGIREQWIKKAEESHNPAAILSKIVFYNRETPTKDLVLEAIASRNIDALWITSELMQSPEEKSSWRLTACRLAEVCNDLSLSFLFPLLLNRWCERLNTKQQSCSLDISLQKIYLDQFGQKIYQGIEARADYLYNQLAKGKFSEKDLLLND